jgi:uncharacterized protein YjbI with pentapeptide repeats
MEKLTRIEDERLIASGSELNFQDVDLSNLDLIEQYFTEAIFEGADLEGAIIFVLEELRKEDMVGSNLKYANLGRTLGVPNLKDANMENAHLKGTRFTTLDFEGINLEGTNLDEVIYIN